MRVTITLGNTIFGSLSGDRKVDWGRIVHHLVSQLVSWVGKSWATPLSSYLFHLYKHAELMTGPEEKVWKHLEMLLKYGESTSDDEAQSESGPKPGSDDEDCTITSPPPKERKTASPPRNKGKGLA